MNMRACPFCLCACVLNQIVLFEVQLKNRVFYSSEHKPNILRI